MIWDESYYLLLLVFGCFRHIVLPYHLRILPRVFMKRMIHLVFCSEQYMKKITFLNIKQKGQQSIVPSSPNHLFAILLKANKFFYCDVNFPFT